LTGTLIISDSGTYFATEENACGVASDTIVVNQLQTPGESFVHDLRYCEGLEHVLTIPAADAAWSTGENGSEITIFNSGQYTAEVSNDCGQGSYVFNVVIADCDLEVFAPNAFTPDGDGINDFWMPIVNGDFDKIQWSIWNRWGELIASSSDASKPWLGDVKGGEYYAPNGVYTYVINAVKDLDVKNVKGFLVLIR
jgi:gliding motility-associated-like protein